MQHSSAFANVLTTALDDSQFRSALAKDVAGTLETRGIRGALSDKEIRDLQKIFAESGSKGQEASSIACSYRGASY